MARFQNGFLDLSRSDGGRSTTSLNTRVYMYKYDVNIKFLARFYPFTIVTQFYCEIKKKKNTTGLDE